MTARVRMPLRRYRSDHPNHVHQVSVVVCKHLYYNQRGLLARQAKPLTVPTLADADREHARTYVLLYVLRDHFSGLFYAAQHGTPQREPLERFLLTAWANSARPRLLRGVPDSLSVAAGTLAVFPGVLPLLEQLDVRLLPPASGFQTAARDVRTVQAHLAQYVGTDAIHASLRLRELQQQNEAQPHRDYPGKTKGDVWREYVPALRFPPKSCYDALA